MANKELYHGPGLFTGGNPLSNYQERRVWNRYAKLSPEQKPKHVGLVADGNGRWAEDYGLSIVEGHKKGASAVADLIKFFADANINFSVWGWSIDNWKRKLTSPNEVDNIFKVLNKGILDYTDEFVDKNGRAFWFGRREAFEEEGITIIPAIPEFLSDSLHLLEEKTKNNTGVVLGLQINYSGDDEITRIYPRFLNAQKSNEYPNITADTPFSREVWLMLGDDNGAMGEMDLWIRPGDDPKKGLLHDSNHGWRIQHAQKKYTRLLLPQLRPVHAAAYMVDYSKTEMRKGGRPIEQVIPKAA